jgi:hypothetical protein
VIVDHLEINNDLKFANVTGSLISNDDHGIKIMVLGQLLFDLKGAVAKFFVKIPDTDVEQDYQRISFRSIFDVEKFFSGSGGSNFIMKSLLNSYRQTNNSDPKFPLKKVRD